MQSREKAMQEWGFGSHGNGNKSFAHLLITQVPLRAAYLAYRSKKVVVMLPNRRNHPALWGTVYGVSSQ